MKRKLLSSFSSTILILSAHAISAADFDYRVESKVHYRNSEENRFPVQFPFPPSSLPTGQSTAFLETVDAGEHVEVSTINLAARWRINDAWSLQGKVDVIDKYDRNPTSDDYRLDLDNLILRYGDVANAAEIPDSRNVYFQIGKFSKFERQHERRTESYGLATTAFNRFEDSGVEVGFDSPSGFYAKASYTTGNPLFMRDPNMLAGDNGTDDRQVPLKNPDPELKSGIVILYDAEIEDFNVDEPEFGAGIGYRWNSQDDSLKLDVMAYGYQRELAEERTLHGTFYGADLDLLDLSDLPGAGGIRLPVENEDKTETGINFWLYKNNFALFAQYVDQDIGGLGRAGREIELSYVVDLPMKITPVLRYSKLVHDFVGHPMYPAPSVWWDWVKIDYAINFDFNERLRLTVEYADHSIDVVGPDGSNNETVVTFLWRHN